MTHEALWTSDEMAEIYRSPNGKAFSLRFKRDRGLPPEMRMFPDPINPELRQGQRFLWDPNVVRADIAKRGQKKGGRK